MSNFTILRILRILTILFLISLTNCNAEKKEDLLRKINILLLGDTSSGKSCFINNYLKVNIKEDYSISKHYSKVVNLGNNNFKFNLTLIDTKGFTCLNKDCSFNNSNRENNLFQLYQIFKSQAINWDHIFFFYSLKEDISNLDENIKSVKLFLEFAGVNTEMLNQTEAFLIIANQRKRIVPAKENALNNISASNNITYLHLNNECGEEIGPKLRNTVNNFLLAKYEANNKYTNNTNADVDSDTDTEVVKNKLRDVVSFIDLEVGKIANNTNKVINITNILESYANNRDIDLSSIITAVVCIGMFLVNLFKLFAKGKDKDEVKDIDEGLYIKTPVNRVVNENKEVIEDEQEITANGNIDVEDVEDYNDSIANLEVKAEIVEEEVNNSYNVIGQVNNEDVQVSAIDNTIYDQLVDDNFCVINSIILEGADNINNSNNSEIISEIDPNKY